MLNKSKLDNVTKEKEQVEAELKDKLKQVTSA